MNIPQVRGRGHIIELSFELYDKGDCNLSLFSPAYLFCYLGNSIIKEVEEGEEGWIRKENEEGEYFLLFFCVDFVKDNSKVRRIIWGNGVNSFCLHKVLQVQFCVTDECVCSTMRITTPTQERRSLGRPILWPCCC